LQEAIEDLADFCLPALNCQTIVVHELIRNVLEAKPRARKAVGHLIGMAFHKEILSDDGIVEG
jgi:hypothetical protein